MVVIVVPLVEVLVKVEVLDAPLEVGVLLRVPGKKRGAGCT